MGETVGSVPGHFRKVAISLHYLLNHEDFTDLTFVCSDGPVHCHKAMLLTHSSLLKYLFSISASHQASDTTVISLPQFEKIIMFKLLQYVYKGKASFKKDQDLVKLYELAEVLHFDMSFAKKDPENDGPRQTAVTLKTKKKEDTNGSRQTAVTFKTKKKKDANKKKETEEKESAKEEVQDLSSGPINKFQGQEAQSQHKPAPVSSILEESPTKKRKDATKKKQTEEKEDAQEVQDEEDLSYDSNKKFLGQAQSQNKPTSVNPILEESPTKKNHCEEKEADKDVQDEDLSSVLIKKIHGQAQSPNKPAPVDPALEESTTNKKKDVNKKKQMEDIEAAKEVQDEDLSSALIKKFQGLDKGQNKPAPVIPILEKSPIIVARKRTRVSQAVEETKGKKYQYYTGNKVSRYQDGSDDDGMPTGQEEEENDSEADSSVGNFIDVGSYEDGLVMDADVEECIKQRAALDKMKVGLKNCGREKNVKLKVIKILEGYKHVQPKNVEEKDRHTDASVIQEVSNDPNFSLKEMCSTSVAGNRGSSDGKDKVPQNMEIKSHRNMKQGQFNENVEGDKPLKENVIGVTSNEIDTSSKPNDGNLNLTKKMEMPSNVEEQNKQKASMDNMKVKVFNCAKEEHIKKKVEALMNDTVEAEKKIGTKVSKSVSKRKSKVKSYFEETSDKSDHSEVEEPFKKQSKKQSVTKAKTCDDSSKTDKEKKKRFKRRKSTNSEEMIDISKMKTAKATDSKAAYKSISCYKCGNKCKTKTELRNHIVTHFYPELFVFLPASKPFTCPTCSALNRDKTSLARHYAFSHKEIYKYCTEDELNGDTVRGKQKSVYCQSSSNGFSQSPDSESWLSSASKNFNKADDDSDDAELFDVRKDVNYAVKSSDDLLDESEAASKTKSVSTGGREGSEPPENISEMFLGMDDNDPVDVDDLLQESDDGSD